MRDQEIAFPVPRGRTRELTFRIDLGLLCETLTDEIRPKKLSLRTRTREEASLPTPSPLLASRVADEAWSNAEIAVETERWGHILRYNTAF